MLKCVNNEIQIARILMQSLYETGVKVVPQLRQWEPCRIPGKRTILRELLRS
jgi:hypothetical protein